MQRQILVGMGLLGTGGVITWIRSKTPQLTNYTEMLPGGIKLEMITIPAGKFLMGSPDTDPDAKDNEKPQHEVELSSFLMGKYPVTQEQYQAIMGNNPSKFDNSPQNPVENVSWNDAQSFCEKLSSKTGKKYRLPSEAEWEYACRAGSQTRYYFGDDEKQLGEYAWYGDNSGDSLLDTDKVWEADPDMDRYAEKLIKNNCRTHPVGLKKPNSWGLFDMSGNVWEWCEDFGHDNYREAPEDGRAWIVRVLRGGSWSFVPYGCRSADRGTRYRADFFFSSGFRLACLVGRTF